MSSLKNRAVFLRKQGYMLSEIAKNLNIAKSTAHNWLKDIELTQKEKTLVENRLSVRKNELVKKMGVKNKIIRENKELILSNEVSNMMRGVKFEKNTEAVLCAIFYWCEGGKDVSSGIKFINSDPAMIEVFLNLLRSSFDIDENKMRALVHLHEYHDQNKQLKFWSALTKIPDQHFYKPYIKPHTGKNTRVDYPGCISIRYHDAMLGKKIKMIYSEFSNIYRGVR